MFPLNEYVWGQITIHTQLTFIIYTIMYTHCQAILSLYITMVLHDIIVEVSSTESQFHSAWELPQDHEITQLVSDKAGQEFIFSPHCSHASSWHSISFFLKIQPFVSLAILKIRT